MTTMGQAAGVDDDLVRPCLGRVVEGDRELQTLRRGHDRELPAIGDRPQLDRVGRGFELSDRRRVGDPEPELGVVIGERGEAARRRVGVDRQGTVVGAGGDRAIRGRHEGDVDRRPGPVVILVVDARRIELGRVGAVGVGDDVPNSERRAGCSVALDGVCRAGCSILTPPWSGTKPPPDGGCQISTTGCSVIVGTTLGDPSDSAVTKAVAPAAATGMMGREVAIRMAVAAAHTSLFRRRFVVRWCVAIGQPPMSLASRVGAIGRL